VHSRPEATADGRPWTHHAEGSVSAAPLVAPADLSSWPPVGAEPMDLTAAYERLAERGYGYGPSFQGLRATWRAPDTVYAEVELPAEAAGSATSYRLHPALLDAAMHADLLCEPDGPTLLPFVWSGVQVHTAGVNRVRVRIVRVDGDEASAIDLADDRGRPVATVRSLVARPVSADTVIRAADDASLLRVEWLPLPLAPADAADSAAVEVFVCPRGVGLHAVAQAALARLQSWLDESDRAALAVVIARGELEHAAVRGLVRAAEAENPGRFVLVESDEVAAPAVLAGLMAAGEPEVAIRSGAVFAPRLTPVRAVASDASSWGNGTVLVTGGTGGLGSLVSRHLVSRHGVRRLILTSRRGLRAPRAAALVAELAELGAEVSVAACDVADRCSTWRGPPTPRCCPS
jgi:hypothetical protein